VTDPLHERDLAVEALELVAKVAGPYLRDLDERPVLDPAALARLDELDGPLPERGLGTLDTVDRLIQTGTATATHSSGPRFFHFVVGGSTPAAQAADWLATLLDQVAGLWLTSPLAARLETVTLDWLKDLFGLPREFGGVLTPSATFANLTGLACARFWWAEQHGVNVTTDGLAGLPRMPVLSSGYLHPSSRKALQLLGVGRDTAETFARDASGALDLDALASRLASLDGPAVIVGNAGEVNAGDFDPIDELADLAERHGAWLHVDGAFGLFARCAPETAALARGVERADSVASDAHKWMNVPYESGFAFVRSRELLGRSFGGWNAAYLPEPDEERINYNNLGPESSRRARALPLWATLRAYGSSGIGEMVRRHHALATRLGEFVSSAPDFELLAPVQLCVVCFRYRPPGMSEEDTERLNVQLGEDLIADGRVYAGTTRYRGRTALRPTIVNWRTTEADIDLLASVVRELGTRLV
jgi:glutamate/tyrosine decarboxylase-like PLP-dependent enzyme